ncbi:initiation factor 2 [Westerdykella ornata]|uniref:Translation initiation factor IF-2, mitochondrial n=1 Tax=Westerdykella ornata TaxID=318751 RepID=A0A6A6JU30_WESOR|nr:initiation factor 2 [Westerdykella ornata]KAF2278539.1 initiation factor 2 [Westerdykella ornata]
MRRASGVKVSSAREVCIFCATRQLTAAILPIASSQFPQRRHLSSSNKAQNASDSLYREAAPRSRPLTPKEQMELMRQRFAVPQQPQPQQTSNDASQAGAKTGSQSRPFDRPQAQRYGSQRNLNPFDRRGPNQRSERYTPNRGDQSQNRYNVRMGNGPSFEEGPQFGSAPHLRRRDNMVNRTNPASTTDAGVSHPPPLRPKLDKDELARLLGNASESNNNVAPRSYTPLARDARTEVTCFTCGQQGHRKWECPERDSDRQQTRMQPQAPFSRPQQESQGSEADAAEGWKQKGIIGEDGVLREQSSPAEEEERRKAEALERLSRKFKIDDDSLPKQTRNRYEEPMRRRGGGQERKGRNRVMRNMDEEDEIYVSKAERKRLREEAKKAAQLAKAEPVRLYLPEYISVTNLASMLKLRVEDFVKKLEELGFEDVQNDHILNAEHAALVAQEYNFDPVIQVESEHDGDLYPAPPLSPEEYAKLPHRPPVVTIMGHVDHGKTTILDYMRSTSVAATEFGGITQHIGAFSVPLSSGKKITFLDTPGHAAFETMRARGANVTDIVVLVVAADDSVMPQTVEAIKHAQAAKVPIIVAINKIDKAQADPERVKLDLGRHGVEVEDFGGDVQTVCVSGKTGQGISDLEDAISLQSEVLDHRADPEANVEGWVLEGSTKKNGRVATILVRNGTLRPGDFLVAGNTWTRVKTLRNEAGAVVPEAGPGTPVEVDGWRDQPMAGDEALQAADEDQASEVAELRKEKLERLQMAKDVEAINTARRLEAERREAQEAAAKAGANGGDAVSTKTAQESGPELVSFIVKGDVSGSVEAVIDSLVAIGNHEVGTRILRSGVGSPSEFDVEHAAAAKGHIVNFNTPVPGHISGLAEEKGVRILDSNIIYRVVEDVKALLSEKLAPKVTQKVTGEAEIAAIFEIGLGGKKKLRVAGSKVRNGIIEKGAKVKVLRKDEVVFDGECELFVHALLQVFAY